MRLLIATVNRSVVGGVETYLRAVVPPLRAAGHSVGLLSSSPPAGEDLLVGVPDIPTWVADSRAGALGGADEWRPDVVYHHGMSDPAIDTALVARFPVVSYAHVYYGTCISGTKCQAAGPVPCHRTFGLACLGLYLPRRCGGRNPLTMVRHYRDNRRRLAAIRDARAVLVASRHMAAEMVRNGVRADRVHHLPLFPTGAAPDPVPPTPRPFSGRVLFVGRLTALKGLNHLLDAVPRAAASLGRPLTLVVAGDGPDRGKLEVAARRAGVDAEFLGWVSPDRRDAEMRAADLLAVPSVWPEPFGLVGVEAGCVGLPAVGYAVGGIPDWLEPGVSGESAPGDRPDPRELAAAIVRALAAPAHWQRLRVGAWETARRFSPEAHLERLIPILQDAARS